MKQKIKHIISIALLVIFLIPITIKGIDFAFHHHEITNCNAKSEKHFHLHKDECFIATFTLSTFIHSINFKLNFFKTRYFVSKQTAIICFFQKKFFYSFLLRGPPQY